MTSDNANTFHFKKFTNRVSPNPKWCSILAGQVEVIVHRDNSEVLQHVILAKKPYGRRLQDAAPFLYAILVR